MVPEAKLSAKQAVKIDEISRRYSQTDRAYRVVEALMVSVPAARWKRVKRHLSIVFMDTPLSLESDEGCRRNNPASQG